MVKLSTLFVFSSFPTALLGSSLEAQKKKELRGVGERKLKSVKAPKGMKSPKSPKSPKSSMIIDEMFTVLPEDNASGSGNVLVDVCGTPHPARSAALQVWQTGMGSTVSIKVRNGRPNTIYTAWLRLNGNVMGGDAIGGSPITGGGATSLAPGSALNSLVGFTPPYDGTSDPINGWMTDMNGNSDFMIQLDFPLVGGAYPFQMLDQSVLDAWTADGGNDTPMRYPVPIINPNDANIEGPFLLRVVSHCSDNLSHGLSPSSRETWFNFP